MKKIHWSVHRHHKFPNDASAQTRAIRRLTFLSFSCSTSKKNRSSILFEYQWLHHAKASNLCLDQVINTELINLRPWSFIQYFYTTIYLICYRKCLELEYNNIPKTVATENGLNLKLTVTIHVCKYLCINAKYHHSRWENMHGSVPNSIDFQTMNFEVSITFFSFIPLTLASFS